MSGMGLGSRGDKNNHLRTSTASQSTDAELDQSAISSVAEYQLVFQQLKQEYPASASGALHQKTMARLAEIKANHDLEEQHEQDRKEEVERPLKMNLASKLVGMIMPADLNTSSKQDPHTVACRRSTVGSDPIPLLRNCREPEDNENMFGASRRRSDISILSNLSGLFDDE